MPCAKRRRWPLRGNCSPRRTNCCKAAVVWAAGPFDGLPTAFSNRCGTPGAGSKRPCRPRRALAGIGLILALGAGVVVCSCWLLSRALCGWAVAMRRRALAAAVKRDNEVGARILVVRGGRGAAAVAAFLARVRSTPISRTTCSAARSASCLSRRSRGRRRAAAPDEAHRRRPHPLGGDRRAARKGVARILARPSNTFEPRAPPVTLAMPKETAEWNDALSRAMAYAAAKQFRPALGRPQDFRAERLQPVVEIAALHPRPERPRADPGPARRDGGRRFRRRAAARLRRR